MKISEHIPHLNCQLWLSIKDLEILDRLAVNPSAMSLDLKAKYLDNINIVKFVPVSNLVKKHTIIFPNPNYWDRGSRRTSPKSESRSRKSNISSISLSLDFSQN